MRRKIEWLLAILVMLSTVLFVRNHLLQIPAQNEFKHIIKNIPAHTGSSAVLLWPAERFTSMLHTVDAASNNLLPLKKDDFSLSFDAVSAFGELFMVIDKKTNLPPISRD